MEREEHNIRIVTRNCERSKAVFSATWSGMIQGEEGLFWLDASRLGNPLSQPVVCVNTAWGKAEELLKQAKATGRIATQEKEEVQSIGKKVNILALGDVGGMVLTGLKLLGGELISRIGIWDLDKNVCRRWEYEMNQTVYPGYDRNLPLVEVIAEEKLFDCDVFVFCASKSVPPLDQKAQDVRMIQFESNRKIAVQYGRMARDAGFSGIFAVVSDPVDPLCREVFLGSNRKTNGQFDGKGLKPEQIQGYGLGVMNGRAVYYAKRDERFSNFLKEGRAFGPHGKDLVIANSISDYDDECSLELTKLAFEANLRVREMGFKPYIAPALSSAVIPLLLTIKGEWHYSSIFLGGVYMGCKNRFSSTGLEIESLPLPEKLYWRLEKAYNGLQEIR